MTALVDLLASSPELLPCQAAERISVRRDYYERGVDAVIMRLRPITGSGT